METVGAAAAVDQEQETMSEQPAEARVVQDDRGPGDGRSQERAQGAPEPSAIAATTIAAAVAARCHGFIVT